MEENKVNSKIYSDILEASKKDDLKTFEGICQDGRFLNLCFGRFPLLSVLYLYESDRILSKYEKKFASVTGYEIIPEDIEVYNLFKSKAKRSLRLFKDTDIIAPYEIKAVLGDGVYLNRYLKSCGDSQFERLKKIFLLSGGRKVKERKGKVLFPPKKLEKKTKALFGCVSAFLVLVIILASLFTVYISTVPDGSSDNPYRVVSSDVFASLAGGNSFMVLNSDIEMKSHIEVLSSSLDGNGKTMYIRNFDGPLFDRISESGSIKNLNIVIENSSLDVKEAFAFVTVLNGGVIENVNVTIKDSSVSVCVPEIVTEAEGTTYIGILSAVNSGTIKGCSVTCSSLSIKGYEHINGYISCIASMNAGYICDCISDGSMETDTVDSAGISAENTETGIIEKCVNYMNIKQTTSSSSWNPNVGGISGSNAGIIRSCVNFGNLEGESLTTLEDLETGEEDPGLTVLIGGIVTQNTGKIQNVINAGNITTSSSKTNSFAGGITAYTTGIMEWCGSKGEISVRTEESYITCVGGLAGRIDGTGSCKNGYSLTEITLSGESSNKFAGGVCGACSYEIYAYANMGLQYISGIAYLGPEEFYSIGLIISAGKPTFDFTNIAKLTEEQIKTTEVYFDEEDIL